ncbi:hypothetical protein RJT34_20382 [Clitoria ternatea]|uniref:Protein FAR1-RELATED SEQUENCE n=1 Tax=Clitoria ternatea TaxID=43366 RepID=A0AAN9P5Q3_CLITE
MTDQCDSHTPLDINSGGCEGNLVSPPRECKREINSSDEDDVFPVPKAGMVFCSESELRSYYTKYANQLGFRFVTRTSRRGHDGRTKYLILACSRGVRGGYVAKRKTFAASRKQSCQAKMNVSLCKDGTYKIRMVTLSHNHELNLRLHLRHIDLIDKIASDQKIIDMRFKRTSEQSDCRSSLQKARHLTGEDGDAEALHKYFMRMQEQDKNFFHMFDLDDSFSVKNVFWADGRSRAAYESFGDVVIVDTTCLSNQYKVPLVTFVGVNHHGQSILFGCGLLLHEDSESFVWLFQSLLHCMSGVPPKGIITDHCKAMQKAVETVYLSTRHRWCISNIMKKVSQQIQGYPNFKSLRDHLHNAVYDTLTTNDFEGKWKKIVDEFGLKDNEWLEEFFLERHHWVPSFVRGDFWAGTSISPCSESTHTFFDGYVSRQTTLRQFIVQCDIALQYKAENEYVADVHSSCNSQACVTKSPIEQQFQTAYTHTKFLEVQHEFVGKADCNVSIASEDGSICHYNVIEDVIIADKPKESMFEVTYNRQNCDINCNCHLFEFRGILCRHSLAVLSQERVKEVPCKYILDRWRKNIRRKYAYVKTSYGVQHFKPHMQRLEMLCNEFNSIANAAAEFEDTSSFVKVALCNLKEKLEAWTTLLRKSSQVDVEESQ